MANAKQDGVYTLDGGRFLIRKGDPLPEGAELDAAKETPEAESEQPAETKAKSGPSETTDAAKAPEQA
jgi:hypothetical protein